MYKVKINRTSVEVIKGDITKQKVDAIINWTTPSLNGGDDIFHYIHVEGGSTIQKDCQRVLAGYQERNPGAGNALPYSDCAISTGGILPINIMIHSVCPDARGIKSEPEFETAVERCLNRIFTAISQYSMNREELRRVAFTPMSPLFVGVDNEELVKKKTVEAIRNYAANHNIRVVKIICSNDQDQKAYQDEFIKTDPTSRFDKLMVKLFGL